MLKRKEKTFRDIKKLLRHQNISTFKKTHISSTFTFSSHFSKLNRYVFNKQIYTAGLTFDVSRARFFSHRLTILIG